MTESDMTDDEKTAVLAVAYLAYKEGLYMAMILACSLQLVVVQVIIAGVDLSQLPSFLQMLPNLAMYAGVVLVTVAFFASIVYHIQRVCVIEDLSPRLQAKALDLLGNSGHPAAFMVGPFGVVLWH